MLAGTIKSTTSSAGAFLCVMSHVVSNLHARPSRGPLPGFSGRDLRLIASSHEKGPRCFKNARALLRPDRQLDHPVLTLAEHVVAVGSVGELGVVREERPKIDLAETDQIHHPTKPVGSG